MGLEADFNKLIDGMAADPSSYGLDRGALQSVARALGQMEGLLGLAENVDPGTGQINRLHAGSIEMTPQGLRVDDNKTFAVLTGAQTYNAESFEDGDMVIGNNEADQANIFWDKSAGKLSFRGGTTEQGYIDTDGAALFGGGDVRLDTSGITIKTNDATTEIVSLNSLNFVNSSDHGIGVVGSWYDPSTKVSFLNARSGDLTGSNPVKTAFVFLDAEGSSGNVVTLGLQGNSTNLNDFSVAGVSSISDMSFLYGQMNATTNYLQLGDTSCLVILSTESKTSNADGAGGAIAVDGSYIYVHDSTEWRRAALSTF